MKKIALFVHHNTTSSKDKIVDDLRADDESLTSSRAEAVRILQQIADKKKSSPGTGYYWSVKPSVRQELGLLDVLADDPPNAIVPTPKQQSPSMRTTVTATTTSSRAALHQSGSGTKDDSPSVSSSGKKRSGMKRGNLGCTALLDSFVKKKKTD